MRRGTLGGSGKKLGLSPLRPSRPSTAGSELSIPGSISSLASQDVSGAAAYQDLSHISATPKADWDHTLPALQTCASIRCRPRMPIFALEGASTPGSGSRTSETPELAASSLPSDLQSCASTARCPRSPAPAREQDDNAAALGILSALSPVVSFASTGDQPSGQRPGDAGCVREGYSDASAAVTDDALDAWSPVKGTQQERNPQYHPTTALTEIASDGNGTGNAGAAVLDEVWVAQLASQLQCALQQVEELEVARCRAASREDELAKQVINIHISTL